MQSFIKKFLTGVFATLVVFLSGNTADAAIKIKDVVFDNSDNLILFTTSGYLQTSQVPISNLVSQGGVQLVSQSTYNPIKKGVLTEPLRVYFDIEGATLSMPNKTWNIPWGKINEMKISQFQKAPDVVRLVLNIPEGKKPDDYNLIPSYNQLILKYSPKITEAKNLIDIYKNSEDKGYIETLKKITESTGKEETLQTKEITNHGAISSDFYLDTIDKIDKGLIFNGAGQVTIKNIMKLQDPKRLVVDLENARVNPDLISKNFILEAPKGSFGDIVSGQIGGRDILRVGQFDPNTIRIVIQGAGALEYRFVTSFDMQKIFLGKRWDITNSQICDFLATVSDIKAKEVGQDTFIDINFSNPIVFSAFEEGNYFHLDIENASAPAPEMFEKITSIENLKSAKMIRIASDKTRFSLPSKDTKVLAQITPDGKNVKISLKPTKLIVKLEKKIEQPKLVIQSYKRVVLDPGHGGSDTGAIRENVYEKTINQEIAALVRKNLLKEKIEVLMTLPFDKTITLQDRVDFSNEANPDIYVSIHANASMSPDTKGLEVHWWRDESFELARIIRENLATQENLKEWDTIDRGLMKSKFYVINHTIAPAVLIETGFMSNHEELKGLCDKKRQKEIAEAI
ncbi:N-acetylmuramoyl-L-alanine amidase, partial [bacterium]|nr:N-acetylmuramoyl-L-alanine amidase [bacterium]